MFSDLKKGFQVHTLDTNTVPKYELGKVVAVSEPRYLPPQPGQYQAMQTRGRFVSHNFFFDMNIAHESKSNKTPLYLIGELIGVPNTVMDSALHELRDRIDKDPKYKDVKNWLESLPKI